MFEQSTMTLEIETTRAIAAQILRHRSFTFQEFSQRYAQTNYLGDIELPELRRQDQKNRQNSTDDLDPNVIDTLNKQMQTLFDLSLALYNQMIEEGIAKRKRSKIMKIWKRCTSIRVLLVKNQISRQYRLKKKTFIRNPYFQNDILHFVIHNIDGP